MDIFIELVLPNIERVGDLSTSQIFLHGANQKSNVAVLQAS